jgi:hypothetical protein
MAHESFPRLCRFQHFSSVGVPGLQVSASKIHLKPVLFHKCRNLCISVPRCIHDTFSVALPVHESHVCLMPVYRPPFRLTPSFPGDMQHFEFSHFWRMPTLIYEGWLLIGRMENSSNLILRKLDLKRRQ